MSPIKRYAIVLLGFLSMAGVIVMLEYKAQYHKKDAELNLMAAEQMGDEWLKVSNIANANAKILREEKKRYEDSIRVLIDNYEEELATQSRLLQIKERINRAKDDDDGNVSAVLRATLASLRDLQAESEDRREGRIPKAGDTAEVPGKTKAAGDTYDAKTK